LASGSKWYPRNIQYIHPVTFLAFLEHEQKQMFCKGLNTAWIPKHFTTLIGGKGLPPY